MSSIAGGLGALNLIRDLAPMELYGLISDWADAYSLLVTRATALVFGWIHWGWIRVTEAEGHLLTLYGLLAVALLRNLRRFIDAQPVVYIGPARTFYQRAISNTVGNVFALNAFLQTLLYGHLQKWARRTDQPDGGADAPQAEPSPDRVEVLPPIVPESVWKAAITHSVGLGLVLFGIPVAACLLFPTIVSVLIVAMYAAFILSVQYAALVTGATYAEPRRPEYLITQDLKGVGLVFGLLVLANYVVFKRL